MGSPSEILSAPGFIPGTVCVGLVLFYYVAVWLLYGRDPSPGHIVSQYEPPGALSPPALRYLRRSHFDYKTFVSAVLDIAAHGCATVSVEYGRYVLTRSAKSFDCLPREEQAFAGRLLKDEFMDFTQANGEHIRSCAATLQDSIREQVEQRFLKTNGEYVILGGAITAFAAIQVLRMTPGGMSLLRWSLGLAGLGVVVLVLNSMDFRETEKNRKRQNSGVQALTGIAVSCVLVAGGVAIQQASWALAAIAAMVAINLIFQCLMKSPTAAGRALMDQVEGFREFLSAVELDKFRLLYPGERTPEVIDRFFPYAFALDLEHEWNDRFGGAVRDSMRIRDREGTQDLDVMDALSVITSAVLGPAAGSARQGR